MQLQAYHHNDPNKNFDYLTNPGGPPQEEEQEEPSLSLPEPAPHA